jgi:hypothetical protein
MTDWTVRADGSDLQPASPGKWNAVVPIAAGAKVYIIGGKSHRPTDRCVGIQGRPINTGTEETWGSTSFIQATGAHCTLPAGWSAPR